MLDDKFVSAIAGLAERAAGQNLRPYRPEAEPAHVYLIDGKRYEAAPPPRSHDAQDLSAIVDFALAHPNSAVWYSSDEVVCLLDDAIRRDRVGLSLAFSPQLETIKDWDGKHPHMKQAELILVLRTMFRDCLVKCAKLIDILRHVQFKVEQSGIAKVSPGKASIGKQLEAEITGVEAIPEEFSLRVPVFASPLLMVSQDVVIAMELDAASQTFQLIPIPGAVEKAMVEGEIYLGNTLMALLGDSYKNLHYGTV